MNEKQQIEFHISLLDTWSPILNPHRHSTLDRWPCRSKCRSFAAFINVFSLTINNLLFSCLQSVQYVRLLIHESCNVTASRGHSWTIVQRDHQNYGYIFVSCVVSSKLGDELLLTVINREISYVVHHVAMLLPFHELARRWVKSTFVCPNQRLELRSCW